MKKLAVLSVVVCLCLSLCACDSSIVTKIKGYLGQETVEKPAGYIETKENELYVYDVFKNYIELIEYMGSETDIAVPTELDGKPVTVIGSSCYYGNRTVETIVVPEGVQVIENAAFYYCTALRRVKLPDSCTEYGEKLFSWCTALETVTLPAGMTAIPDYAFNNCTSLSEIVWNGTVNHIGVRAFSWCTALAEVDLPLSVQTISDFAFYNCGTLQSVTIPEGAVYKENAFEKCDNATVSGGIVDETTETSTEASAEVSAEAETSIQPAEASAE